MWSGRRPSKNIVRATQPFAYRVGGYGFLVLKDMSRANQRFAYRGVMMDSFLSRFSMKDSPVWMVASTMRGGVWASHMAAEMSW